MQLPPNLAHEAIGSKGRWRWGDWTSPAFDELEIRPWTPLVIAGRLCFSASEQGKWYIVHGDEMSLAYDDAYDTTEWHGKPLYIARQGCRWFLVWASCKARLYHSKFDTDCRQAWL